MLADRSRMFAERYRSENTATLSVHSYPNSYPTNEPRTDKNTLIKIVVPEYSKRNFENLVNN